MQSRKSFSTQALIFLLTVLVLFPGTVSAQEPISKAALDEWFYSRLIWGVGAGIIAGGLAGVMHLCRLPFQFGSLNVNSRARRRFAFWTVAVLLIGFILLFLDAWLLHPFRENVSMTFGEAFTEVWLNYRTILILVVTIGVFTLAVAVSTRLKSDCNCRYAFLPGPRGK